MNHIFCFFSLWKLAASSQNSLTGFSIYMLVLGVNIVHYKAYISTLLRLNRCCSLWYRTQHWFGVSANNNFELSIFKFFLCQNELLIDYCDACWLSWFRILLIDMKALDLSIQHFQLFLAFFQAFFALHFPSQLIFYLQLR